MRRAGLIATGMLLVGLTGVAFASTASAASCAKTSTMTIKGNGLGGIELSPSTTTISLGGCVAFDNATGVSATVSVDGKPKYGPKSIAPGATAVYSPAAAGKDSVAVSSKTALLHLPTSTSGSMTVSPAPKPSPTPGHHSPSPAAGHSSQPSTQLNLSPTTSGSKPGTGKSGVPKPAPHATGIALPPLPPLPSSGQTAVPLGSNPLIAPGPTTSAAPDTTSTLSASPAAAIVAGPLEPTDNNRRGLPEAVGVCVVLGLATGWGRVLLASPDSAVDDAPLGDHSL